MNNIKINYTNSSIIITKNFEKAAQIFKSKEYNELKAARDEFPGFTISTKNNPKSTKSQYKGLDYNYMEKYIASHDNEEKTIMKDYLDLRGKSEAAKNALANSASYGEIKEWFLDTYPEIAKFHKRREELLNKHNPEQKAS